MKIIASRELGPINYDGGAVFPLLDNVYTLGTTAKRWANVYAPIGRGVTLHVAASNATAAEKAQADYLCDGTADDVEINAAITALPAAGGKIQLSTGLITLANDSQITLTGKSSIWLIGSEGTKIQFVSNPGAALYLINVNMATGTSWARISDIELYGGSFANAGGIYVTAANPCHIDNCYIHHFGQYGVANAQETHVTNCRITHIGQYGVELFDRSLVSNCHIAAELDISPGLGAIVVNNMENVISGNRLNDGVTAVVRVNGECVVTGNQIQGSSGRCIILSATAEAVVVGNTIQGRTALEFGTPSAGVEIWGDGNVVTGNRFHDLGKGVFLTNDNGDKNTIAANHFDSSTITTVVDNSSSATGNVIRNNVDYIAPGEVRAASGSLVPTGTCTATTVTGTFTESPLALKPGANTMHCTASGTINVVMPAGSTAVVTSVGGGATVTDSPKTCPAGATTLVTVTAGGTNDFTITVHSNAFAWHNPETQDILIKKIVINRTAAGGTATAEMNVGVADNGTVDDPGTEFFNNMLVNNAAAVHDSHVAGGTSYGTQTIWVNCEDSASATDGWVVGKIDTEIANSLAGTYYIEYVGK